MPKRPRREPYTAIGIKRVPCAVLGCDEKSHASWGICADGNQHRGVCKKHDIALNETAMRLVFGRTREADLKAYRKKVLSN